MASKSRRFTVRLPPPFGRVRRLVRWMRSRALSEVARESGVDVEEIHQVEHTTAMDRYPELFQEVARHRAELGGATDSILSFGCSSGEECRTLRTYFPDARIVGADINRESLALARAWTQDPRIQYLHSAGPALEESGPFDLVQALAVLCRWPELRFVEDASEVYPFDRYLGTLRRLDHLLKPGGTLVILNSCYRLEDTELVSRYRPVPGGDAGALGHFMPRFLPDGSRLSASEPPQVVVWDKLEAEGRVPS